MKLRYQIVKRNGTQPAFKYTYYLLDTKTPDVNDFGFRVVTSMWSNNPVCAPQHLRNRQAEFNTRDALG